MKKVLFIALVGAIGMPLAAQQLDSVTWLKEILVNGNRSQNAAIGYYLEGIDSIQMDQSQGLTVAEIIQRNVPGGLRSYGISGLSTLNLRGTGSSHTAILWNGINLQSPASGQMDLNQLNTGFVDDISIQFGGSSSAFGGGAIGGTLHLNNYASEALGFDIQTFLSVGSFGRMNQRYHLQHGGEQHSFSVGFSQGKAANDFKFENTSRFGSPEEKWEHASTDDYGFLGEYYLNLSGNNSLKALWWYQSNDLEIPSPSTVRLPGTSTQSDNVHRTLVEWKKSTSSYELKTTSALVASKLDYQDSLVGIASNSDYVSVQNNVIFSKALEIVDISFAANHTLEKVISSGFSGGKTFSRNLTSLQSEFKSQILPRTFANFAIRQELLKTKLTPITPTLAINHSLSQTMVTRFVASRVYRNPTFNDLYWNGPGGEGNRELKAERGWSLEAGLNWEGKKVLEDATFDISVYRNAIEDWIQWAPITSSVWSPFNIKKVIARGVQTKLDWIAMETNFITLRSITQYQLSHSVNSELNSSANLQELDKQLIYTPKHQGSQQLQLQHSKINISYMVQYIGRQFTTGDNNEIFALSSYLINNVSLSVPFRLGPVKGVWSLNTNNIFNQHYQVRLGYPMPGFNLITGIKLNLNTP